MKTLLLMDSLAPGGTERQMELLLRHWPKLADPIELVVFEASNADRRRFEAVASVRVIGRRRRFEARFLREVRRIVRGGDYDVVLAPHRFAGLLALVAGGTPVVPCVRGRHQFSRVQHLLYDRLHPWLMERRAPVVLVNSEVILREFEARPRLAEKTRLVPNGVEIGRFEAPVDRTAMLRSLGIAAGARIVLAVGRLVEIKNPMMAVAALGSGFRDRNNVHLIWVGDGPMREAVEAFAVELGLADRVHLLGNLDDPASWLGSADVFVHPSNWENTSNAIIEAMAARVPVVACDVGGNNVLLGGGSRGILVPAGDEDAMGLALANAIEDQVRSSDRAAAARIFVGANYSAENMVRAHMDALRMAAMRPRD